MLREGGTGLEIKCSTLFWLELTTGRGKQADPGNTANQQDAKRKLEFEALSAHPLVRCLLPMTSAR